VRAWLITLFIDGIPILRQESTLTTFTNEFSIGDPEKKGYNFAQIKIGDIQALNYALNDAQIYTLHNMDKDGEIE
jgi:hypothetical protein